MPYTVLSLSSAEDEQNSQRQIKLFKHKIFA